MKSLCLAAMLFTELAWVATALGHGTPVRVTVAENQLVVSGGHADALGFAPYLFAEVNEDGEATGPISLPNIGLSYFWELPGFEINGMNDASSLSIEVLQLAAMGTTPAEDRLLWYWNPATSEVESSAARFHLLGKGQRFLTLTNSADAAPPPFLLASAIGPEQGFHNHSMLAYALESTADAPHGIYGLFARVASNDYAPSEPFLLAFNHGVSPESALEAALAINFAAGASPPTLAGDYDLDGEVTAGDYLLWKQHIGETVEPTTLADGNGDGVIDSADYTIWRDALGASEAARGAVVVPEPKGLLLALVGLWASALLCGFRQFTARYRACVTAETRLTRV